MKFQLIFLYLVICALADAYAQQSKIVIELETGRDVTAAGYEVWLMPDMDEMLFTGKYEKHRFSKQSNGVYAVTILTDAPKVISDFSKLPFPTKLSALLIPGDSVRIREVDGTVSFSGRGAEAFAYLAEAGAICNRNNYDSLLPGSMEVPKSEDGFWDFVSSFGGHFLMLDDLLSNYKDRLAPERFALFKGNLMAGFQSGLAVLMGYLSYYRDDLNLSGSDLCRIYDQVLAKYGRMVGKPVDTLGVATGIHGLALFARISYLRSNNFKDKEERLDGWPGTYYFCKSKFSGLLLRRILTRIVNFYLIRESPGDDIAYEPIKDYLTLTGYESYKKMTERLFLSKFKVSFYDIGPDRQFINKSLYKDGPYVFRNNQVLLAKYIKVVEGKLMIQTDTICDGETIPVVIENRGTETTLNVRIGNKADVESSEYPEPSGLVAISDIEGNLDVFIKLLQANGVIDDRLNWVFGSGHLVLIGDFVDRGTKVTEVLWLIYSLEAQAKKNNGYVHLILGNHEIMNLNNFTSYVHKKYLDNAKLLKEDYASGLYGERSVIGRWLRTKNVVEKIGDILFTHAGISLQMNNLDKSLDEVNQLARQHYGREMSKDGDKPAAIIMSSSVGPFWYRGYYEKYRNATLNQVDSSLRKFGVNRIVTGHTIIGKGEKITTHFDGKVINTDTYHAGGRSEALRVEDGTYYRVNIEGRRMLLLGTSDQIADSQ